MEISDIKLWASTKVRKVRITHGYKDANYELELCQFVPLPDDMLYQEWTDRDRGITKHHPIPPYAIADMRQAATQIQQYVDSSIVKCLIGFLGNSDALFWDTFQVAFQWTKHASVSYGVRMYTAVNFTNPS